MTEPVPTDRELSDMEARIVVRHMPDVLRDITVWVGDPEQSAQGTIDASDFQAIVRETIAAYRKAKLS